MSYILDALRKAEAERKLGDLPGVHSRQSVAAGMPPTLGDWRARHAWLAMPAGLAVVIALLGGWQFGFGRHQAMPGTAAATVSMQPESAAAAAPALPVRMPAMPAASTTVSVLTEIPVPAPVQAPKSGQAPRKPPAAAGGLVTLPVKKPAPALQSPPVSALTDLPPAMQREIPPLLISGSMYSANPADRMVLLDKRMLHEGDEVAPGLTLDRVLPKGAILRYKGHVFQITH